MELRRIEISKLKEAPYNPRVALQPGDAEFEKLKRSLADFGDVEPIVWNERSGYVVGGHQKLAVLKFMGKTETLVSVVDLDDTQEKQLNIALLSGLDAQEITLMLAKNDDVEDDFDFASFESEGEDDEYEAAPGTSYIVSLVFKNNFYAQEWAKEHGYKKAVKEGKKTTVIRME